MHLEKIEEYNFEHGLHFDVVTGEYSSLNPHTLGRPLTHEEMDYNLLYQKQTVNGYRIAGSNNDLTLSTDDLGKVLSFVQISDTDTDWSRWSDAGLLAGQFIWAPVEMYTTTQATTIATTAATTAQTQPTTQATAATTLATTTEAPTYTVTITAVANPSNIVGSHPYTQSGVSDSFTIPGPTWSVTGFTFLGYDTYSGTPMAPPQYQPGDVINVTSNVSLYARYEVTPTTTEATQATTMATNATTIATLFTMTVTPTIVTEESTSQDTLQYKVVTSPAVPAGTTVEYTISGAWAGPGNNTPGPNGDIQVHGVNLGAGGGVSQPMPLPDNPQNPYTNTFVFDNNGEAAINVYVLNDTNYDEIQESVIVTLAANDSDGRPTGSISITGAINPATTIATTLATQATTLATQPTTLATQATTLPPVLGYYFHGGQNNYPANADLTAGTGVYFYDPGSGFTQTNDFDLAMSYIMDNLGTMGNGVGSEYDILTFNIPSGGIPALGNSDQLVFPTNDTAELYYIILPDGQVDLTDPVAMHLYNTNFGANTNAVAKRSFTWNGDLYWIYKTGFQGDVASRTLGFNNSPTA